ncbi:VWA domain-containing protein [Hyalangium gracile]|uniref:VWA domain-containing protein n=1 Tax=Hyalangium gracile TaxID=394092 RepID=UPI001CC93E49|nr:VWA domain-containing protein [Hyalangium gracile]
MNRGTSVAVVVLFALVCGVVLYSKMSPSRGGDTPTPSGKAADPSPTATPKSDKPTIDVLYASSDGKKEWVNDVVKTFNEKRVEINGKVVVVKAEHMRSGESRAAILAGKSKPTIWGPAGKSWIDLINQDWQTREQRAFVPEAKDTVNTALVIALWKPMAEALGWPKKEIGWKDLRSVVTNPKGWSALGHPEWGAFKFGHSHPDYSNSAMLSVISMIYAGANKSANLTSADMKDPQVVSLLKDIERSIVHYGESSSWLTDKLCNRGPAYLSAVTVYESSVVKANDKCKTKPFPLVALYPKEGTYWETHPAGVVDADWVTEDQKQGAKAFLDFLVSPEQQAKAPKYGFRPALKDVPLTAPFDEDHGVSPNAERKELEYLSEDLFQRANTLWHETKKKAAVWVVLDTSGSMEGKPMDAARAGTVKFLQRMEPDDLVQVIAFSEQPTALGNPGKVRQSGETLVKKVQGLYAHGQTSLYDAVLMAFDEVDQARKTETEPRSYGIVVLSDGKDTASKRNKPDLIERLPRPEDTEGTRVFTIAYGNEADEELLRTLSERSNALMVHGDSADIDKLYHQIASYF